MSHSKRDDLYYWNANTAWYLFNPHWKDPHHPLVHLAYGENGKEDRCLDIGDVAYVSILPRTDADGYTSWCMWANPIRGRPGRNKEAGHVVIESMTEADAREVMERLMGLGWEQYNPFKDKGAA